MSVTNILDRVTDWARESVCSKIWLKTPPDSETDATDKGYDYRRVNPAAFTMYVPTKEKLPPAVLSPFPSVCVRCAGGEDHLNSGKGSVNIELCFSAWSTGTHGKDLLFPDKENALRAKWWSGPEAEAYFQRNGGGWRDAWNMVDIALREIESVTNIDGILIDRSTPVKFGPLTEQEAIPDYYPFWFAWVSFSVNYNIIRNIREIEGLL
mgnify:CR=1 FL=1